MLTFWQLMCLTVANIYQATGLHAQLVRYPNIQAGCV